MGNQVNKFETLNCVLDVVCLSGHVSVWTPAFPEDM